MPLIKEINKHNCTIGIWEMNESLTQLLKLSKITDLPDFKNKKKKYEFLSSRLLLSKLLPNASITYNKYNAPEIEGSSFISISHSTKLAAIIISKTKAGLDIEQISKKPLKLASKFISKYHHNPLSEEKATLIWSCKEAIFKWHQKGNVNFIMDIEIAPFFIKNKGTITAKFKAEVLTLHYEKINTHFLVYVCK